MATYRARLTSPRPPTEVFDYMARFSNAAEWDPGVTGSTEAEPGAPALGRTYRLTVRSFGRAVPLEYRIVEFDRPHRVVITSVERTVEFSAVSTTRWGRPNSTMRYSSGTARPKDRTVSR